MKRIQTKRVTVSREGQMKRLGGKFAFSTARKSNDPLIKRRDKLRSQLLELNARIRQKYGRKGLSEVRTKLAHPE